jgi:hypothetical protein
MNDARRPRQGGREGAVRAADVVRYRLTCYLAALSLVSPSQPVEIATLQGRARAMRMLLSIEAQCPGALV